MPKRIQRKRTRGWKNPPNTIYVGRPTKWGNPYQVYKESGLWFIRGAKGPGLQTKIKALDIAIQLYRNDTQVAVLMRALDLEELRGKNLSCWCPLTQICHADVLLDLLKKKR